MDALSDYNKDQQLGRLAASMEHLAGEMIGLRTEVAELRRKVDRGGGMLLGMLISAGTVGASVGPAFTSIFNK